MSEIVTFENLSAVADHFRKDLTGDHRPEKRFILLFAHNGTGKTRLSMEFKELGKKLEIHDIVDEDGNSLVSESGDHIVTEVETRDTLYFNAFTEDLFTWNNDLDNDSERYIQLNQDSAFFEGLHELDMDTKIESFFQNYVNLKFAIDYDEATVKFARSIIVDGNEQTVENIKISRGEENLFIWCFFLAVCQLAIDKDPAYNWVKYIYIDDPISSLDENKAVAVACDLANLIRAENNETKTVVSTHHSLFFNVMYNELCRKVKNKCYYLHAKEPSGYSLQDTGDTPFFHHIAILGQLKQVVASGEIYTHHFNALRSILEKTASFFGYDKIDKCIHGLDDEVLFERALQLFSHGKYSVFDPREMGADNKELYKRIFEGFLNKYEFYLPEIFNEETQTEAE